VKVVLADRQVSISESLQPLRADGLWEKERGRSEMDQGW
jgi:hypothetical protein